MAGAGSRSLSAAMPIQRGGSPGWLVPRIGDAGEAQVGPGWQRALSRKGTSFPTAHVVEIKPPELVVQMLLSKGRPDGDISRADPKFALGLPSPALLPLPAKSVQARMPRR